MRLLDYDDIEQISSIYVWDYFFIIIYVYYTTLCNTWFWLVDHGIDWSDFSTIVYGLLTFSAALGPEIFFSIHFSHGDFYILDFYIFQ